MLMKIVNSVSQVCTRMNVQKALPTSRNCRPKLPTCVGPPPHSCPWQKLPVRGSSVMIHVIPGMVTIDSGAEDCYAKPRDSHHLLRQVADSLPLQHWNAPVAAHQLLLATAWPWIPGREGQTD